MLNISYPREVMVDFRKLDTEALKKILSFYHISTGNKELDHSSLAALVCRQFHVNAVVDSDVLDHFIDHQPPLYAEKSSSEITGGATKRRRTAEYSHHEEREHAKTGEQVAAKVLSGNENGSWILGNVIDYDGGRDLYEIQDEDDNSRIITLSSREVRRLEETTSHFRKGDGVLCVFPDTTSFYRAVVARNPKPPAHGNSSWDLVVRFEDDEDETGVAPPRRVPGRVLSIIYCSIANINSTSGRFVLRRADIEDNEDD
jgi:SAGA-associated factor 29